MATRRAYAGAPVKSTITSGINATDLTITIAASTGWPSGNPFYVVIDPGTASAEKVKVTRSGTTLTVAGTGDRGADGTSAASHSGGAVIYPVWTAVEADEVNAAAVTVDTLSAGVGARHGVRLRRNAAQTIVSGSSWSLTTAEIAWDVEDQDTDAYLAVTSDTITIPANLGGMYALDLLLENVNALSAGSTGIQPIGVVVNGTYRRIEGWGGGTLVRDAGEIVGASAVLYLAAGDTLKVRVEAYLYGGGAGSLTAALKATLRLLRASI